jgi:MFS family permease
MVLMRVALQEMTVLTMLRAPVMREFGIDKYFFAMIGSVIFAGMLVGSLAGGAVADLYGRRRSMLMSGMIFCIFAFLSAVAPDIYTFAVARVLTGFGVGGMVPVADSLLLEWSPTQWRSKLVMTMIGACLARAHHRQGHSL